MSSCFSFSFSSSSSSSSSQPGLQGREAQAHNVDEPHGQTSPPGQNPEQPELIIEEEDSQSTSRRRGRRRGGSRWELRRDVRNTRVPCAVVNTVNTASNVTLDSHSHNPVESDQASPLSSPSASPTAPASDAADTSQGPNQALVCTLDFDDDEVIHDDDIIPPLSPTYRYADGGQQTESWYSWVSHMHDRLGSTKRSRSTSKTEITMNMGDILKNQGAAAAVVFSTTFPDGRANDIWPELRNPNKIPARYCVLGTDPDTSKDCESAHRIFPELHDLTRPTKLLKRTTDCSIAPPTSPGWPPRRLPTELYEAITDYLNRDDIKSMRLVCREFDYHVSRMLFKTAVVPFNTEIYGMLSSPGLGDGDGNIKPGRLLRNTLSWMNGSDDDIYSGHGLDIFRGFGRHIRRFGMSFEVDEYALGNLPKKSPLENQSSFWGRYEWPMEEYCRFRDVAVLESTADETPRMAIAFSELTNVRELALSINSGLGWLNGPDRSIRAAILEAPPSVFGNSKSIPDRRTQARNELWEYVASCYPQHLKEDLRVATMYKSKIPPALLRSESVTLHNRQPEMPFLDPRLVHEALLRPIVPAGRGPGEGGPSILFTAPPPDSSSLIASKFLREFNVNPVSLSAEQNEWLLETGWAQRAFLASYMLSVIDNHAIFENVHTLNISRLSCCYIHLMDREDFWDALPMLENVTLRAIADFRTVRKDDDGSVQTPLVDPSDGINPFYNLLRNRIVPRETVKQLTIGWETGGEHAEGLFARNRLLLPAPVLPPASATSLDAAVLERDLLVFPWVNRLTVENCWMTPVALFQMVQSHDQFELRHLTLDSVSLAGVNVFPGLEQQLNQLQHIAFPVAAHAQGVGQAHANVQTLTQHSQYVQHQLHAMTMQLQWLQMQAAGQGQGHFIGQAQAQLQGHINNLGQMHTQLLAHIHANQQQQLAHPGHNMGTLFVQLQAMAPMQNPAPPVAAYHDPDPDPETVLNDQPQVGSWLYVLDIISPGLNLSDFGSTHSRAQAERKTSLDSITLKSCGYAVLSSLPMDNDRFAGVRSHPAWDRRRYHFVQVMLQSNWPLLGKIVQDVNQSEAVALGAAWGLETGWSDIDAAQGPEFDGLLPGGTGRFSGSIQRRASGS